MSQLLESQPWPSTTFLGPETATLSAAIIGLVQLKVCTGDTQCSGSFGEGREGKRVRTPPKRLHLSCQGWRSSSGPIAACSRPRTCPLPAAAGRWLEIPRSSRQLHIGHLHVTTDPTRTKQAPRQSLTGKRETQTAERREKERERWRERCRNGLPPQPAKNSVRNTGEETLTESRPWEERVQPLHWPGPVGHFILGMV